MTEWNLITVGEGAGEGAQSRPIISKATVPRSLGKAVCNLVPRPAQLPASSPLSVIQQALICADWAGCSALTEAGGLSQHTPPSPLPPAPHSSPRLGASGCEAWQVGVTRPAPHSQGRGHPGTFIRQALEEVSSGAFLFLLGPHTVLFWEGCFNSLPTGNRGSERSPQQEGVNEGPNPALRVSPAAHRLCS